MSALLAGRNRWLTSPSTVAVMSGIGLAVIYAWSSVTFPEGTRLSFGVILALVAVAANFTGDALEQRRLKVLRGLGNGSLSPTVDNLAAAAHETVRAPDVSFATVLGFMVLGGIVTGAVWPLFAQVPRVTVVRIVVIGVTLAPLTALMANLVMLPRARAVLRELVDAGLPLEELYARLPNRYELRGRLIVFAAVAVVTPLFLIANLALDHFDALVASLPADGTPEQLREAWASSGTASVLPLLVVTCAVVAVVLGCAFLAGTVVGAPVKELAAETERLAAGRYGAPRFVPAEFETWSAAGAIASMEVWLLDAMNRLNEASGGIANTTGDLVAGKAMQLGGAEEQTAAMSATSATTEELARSARQIALNAQKVSELARETLTAARSGKASADAFTGAMQQVREGNQAIADSVVRLNKRVQQVGRIIEFIDGIADKSDLLALNAELEGNKAGEIGRGFSLVAAEMRRLAESVMQSTREIGRLIEEIRDATNAAVMATEAGVKATDAGAALAQKVGEGLGSIVDFANLSSDAMQSISLATGQQQAGTDQLVSAMAEILRATNAAVTSSREMGTAHDQLVGLAAELKASVSGFEGKS